MKAEYYEDMLEQEAINKYLNMIANDYNGELAKIFKEKYINKDKEIERLKELCNKYEEEHKTTFEIWQKDIKENEHLRTALNSKESIIKEAIEYIEKHKETREHYEPFGTPMGNPNYITTHILGYYELLEILGRAEEE